MHWLSKTLLIIGIILFLFLALVFGVFSWQKTVYFTNTESETIAVADILTAKVTQGRDPSTDSIFLAINYDFIDTGNNKYKVSLYPIINKTDTLKPSNSRSTGYFYFATPNNNPVTTLDLVVKIAADSST